MSALVRPRELRVLRPGELFCGRGSLTLTAAVGAGVSVCLWDPRARVGGMNHYLEPRGVKGAPASYRFGVCALPELLCRLRALAGPTHPVEARIFGGAHLSRTERALSDDNVAFAREVLAALRIPVVALAVGGTAERRVVFELESGKAHVR